MGFSREEYWNGLPFPSLGYLPNPGIKPTSPALQVDSLPSEPPGNPRLKDTTTTTTKNVNLLFDPVSKNYKEKKSEDVLKICGFT